MKSEEREHFRCPVEICIPWRAKYEAEHMRMDRFWDDIIRKTVRLDEDRRARPVDGRDRLGLELREEDGKFAV